MSLISQVWQKLVWCGWIGGGLGIVCGIIGLFQKSAGDVPQSIPFNLFFDAVIGTCFGLILLGIPASIWVAGRWIFRREKSSAATAPPSALGGAMLGSTAAVPAGILGGLGGAALAAIILYCLYMFMLFSGATWYNDIVKHSPVAWYAWFIGIGGVIGVLAGWFFGSVLGAIFGGLRARSRR